jgi:hypothetical protein
MNGSVRLLLDQIFGRENFREEIIVPRKPLGSRGVLASRHDTIFHFSVGPKFVFNPQTRQLMTDEIATQFIMSDEGGRIFWGVRNGDRVVVGVKLTADERDRLRQVVTNKLCSIRPSIDPTSYRLEIHPVEHPMGESELVVVELVVPNVRASSPYFTGGNEAFVRLDGVKRKLAGPELVEWIVRRMSNS